MTYCRFCIVAEGRTGSGMLIHTLRSHPNVVMHGEIYNRSNVPVMESLADEGKLIRIGEDPVDFMESHIFSDQVESTKAVGFKMAYNHARDDAWSKTWIHLRRTASIIHLKRKNLLDRYLSARLSERDGLLETMEDNVFYDPMPIYLDEQDVERKIAESQKKVKDMDQYLRSTRTIDIYYEELVEDVEIELSRVLDFLHLPPSSLFCPSYRLRTRTKPQMIENYADLKKHFSNSPFGEFFDE